MILFELLETENHAAYRALEVANGSRQYDFLHSLTTATMAVQRLFLSTHVIKALNFHAIACLHVCPGEFRPCPVRISDGTHEPPAHFRVQALMDDFVNTVNRAWETADPFQLAAFVLWRLNWIHPFVNGNGRTARAACYFVLCAKAGGWLPGATILPELLRRERARYVLALRQADGGDFTALVALLTELVAEQVGAPPPSSPAAPPDPASPASEVQPGPQPS